MKVIVKTKTAEGADRAKIRLNVIVDFDPFDEVAREEACRKIAEMVKASGMSGDELASVLAALKLEAAALAAQAKG
jgi:hypothetical protein